MKPADAIQISPNDWILTGGGAQGESFNHVSDDGIMLKLFKEAVPVETIIGEIEISRKVSALGVSCPQPVEFVCYGKQFGIIYRRILNKKSFCRAMSDNPAEIPEKARRLALMGRDLHTRPADTSSFTSLSSHFRNMMAETASLSPYMKGKMEEAFERVESTDTQTYLHGDFHFGNAVTDGSKDYFIDLGLFGYGNPRWDISSQWILVTFGQDEMLKKVYHISKAQAVEFWDIFLDSYYGPARPTDEEMARQMAPYALLRTLFYEQVLGTPYDHLRAEFIKLMDN